MKKQMILPCVRSIMGEWIVYSSSMSAEEMSISVQTDKKYRESENLDLILQRDLKERKKQISKYILSDKNHFFNSIIIGVFGGIPKWHEFEIKDKINELTDSSLEYNYSVGLLQFDGQEEMFAIDGQHRVAGIQIAFKDDKNKILSDDRFPVLFVAHIDDENGRKRTRKLFSDINKNAKPVATGDKLKIDEENLNAIVARKLYAEFSHFKNGKIISLTEGNKLENNDIDHFTNLSGLNNSNIVLKRIFKKTPKTAEWDIVNVSEFYRIVTEFYDFVIENITEYHDFFIEGKTNLKDLRHNNAHLLFRPVGLKLLAGLYVHFYQSEKGLDFLKDNINKISFVFPESPFNKVLWNNGKMEAREANQKLALELSLYILNQFKTEEQEQNLLNKYRDLLKNPEIKLPRKIL